jgi:N,N'-diacetylchitobiose transport system permease protein
VTVPAGSPRPARRRRRRPRNRVANLVGLIFCLLWAFPLYWMLNTSFKTTAHLLSATPQFVPAPFSLDNFDDALRRPGFLSSLGNSLLLALSVTAASMVLGFLAAAALSRFYFRGRKVVLVVIIGVQMIPSTALLIPLFLSLESVGLTNSFLGLGLAYVSVVLPFSIWLLRGFFQALPPEIEEAAAIDGAGTFRILRSILLPLVMPGLIATSVFAFIASWNDYIVAFVLMKDQSKYTLPVWLVSFSTATRIDYGGLIAASLLFTVPVVVFFLLVQRNLVAGVSAGAVKG